MRQEDAALIAGVTPAMYGRYERGVSLPNADVLVRLLSAGVDINWCLGGMRLINDEGTLPERERVLLERYRDMDEDGRAAIDRAAAMEAVRSATGKFHPGQEKNATSNVVFGGNVKARHLATGDMHITVPAKKPKR